MIDSIQDIAFLRIFCVFDQRLSIMPFVVHLKVFRRSLFFELQLG